MKSKFALRTLFTLALGLLLAACSSGASGISPAPGAKAITINTLDTFKFDPTTITGKVGQPIHITLANKGVLEHSFVIDELSVKVQSIQGGATTDTTFTPTAAGTYVFYCITPGHKEAGMTGTLVINP